MDNTAIATAIGRAADVIRRRPGAALRDDSTASAHWCGGLRVVSRHANGCTVETDMPGELGGTGDRVSPGWLVRAGLASCAATMIAMSAATEGIVLDELDVEVASRSDLRGMLGIADDRGAPVAAGMQDVTMRVRIAARGVAPERVRALAAAACRASPMTQVLERSCTVALEIDMPVEAVAA